MGDLIVTCWSPSGRNRRAGELIAQGRRRTRRWPRSGMVVEGLTTAPVLRDLSQPARDRAADHRGCVRGPRRHVAHRSRRTAHGAPAHDRIGHVRCAKTCGSSWQLWLRSRSSPQAAPARSRRRVRRMRPRLSTPASTRRSTPTWTPPVAAARGAARPRSRRRQSGAGLALGRAWEDGPRLGRGRRSCARSDGRRRAGRRLVEAGRAHAARQRAGVQALIAKSDEKVVTRDIEGWTRSPRSEAALDAYEQALDKGLLARLAAFTEATAGLPGGRARARLHRRRRPRGARLQPRRDQRSASFPRRPRNDGPRRRRRGRRAPVCTGTAQQASCRLRSNRHCWLRSRPMRSWRRRSRAVPS